MIKESLPIYWCSLKEERLESLKFWELFVKAIPKDLGLLLFAITTNRCRVHCTLGNYLSALYSRDLSASGATHQLGALTHIIKGKFPRWIEEEKAEEFYSRSASKQDRK